MPLPGDLLALLNACRADPVSDLPRLVLADWLDEHDDPARAEFLRVQCELARPSLDTERVAELKARERALIGVNWRAWAGGLHEVCCATLDEENRRERRDRGDTRPVRKVVRNNPNLTGLLWKFTRGLIDLETTPSRIGDLRAWAAGDELPWLDALRMPLRSSALGAGASSWVLPRALRPYLSVDLLVTPWAESAPAAVARSRHWQHVRRVTVHENGPVIDGDLQAALRQADFTRVVQLKLVTADYAGSMGLSLFPKLVALDLGGAGVARKALTDFSKRTPRLNVLIAWRTPIGDKGFAALLATSWGETLHTLEVMNCDLGDDAMAALVNSGLFGRLYGPQLNLSMNRVGDAGVEALAASPFAANLRYLDLWKNRLTDRAAIALAESPHLGQLRDLNVRDNALTDVGREVLTARYGAVAKVGF